MSLPGDGMSDVVGEPSEDGLVWHYTDGTGLVSIVRSHVLWATASGFLNDRDEVRLGLRLLRDELVARAGGGDDFARDLLERVLSTEQASPRSSASTFFILSAAEHWDLLAMWRLYGGHGESYAIGLDPSVPLRVLCDEGAPALAGDLDDVMVVQRPWTSVRYSAEGQRALAAAVFDGMEDELKALRARVEREGEVTHRIVVETLGETLDDIEQALALIKHEGFHAEREVRHSSVLLHPDDLAPWRGVVRYRASAYGMAPHLWLTGADPDAGAASPLTRSVAALPIRAVAISPSPTGREAERSLAALLASEGYDVEVRRSGIPFRG